MSTLPFPPFLCIITDDSLPAERIAGIVDAACASVSTRVVVQLRARGWPGRDVHVLADRLRAITARAGSLLVINDRVDVAVAVGADGVHLPASGISPQRIREFRCRCGETPQPLLVGLSVHTLEEIRRAGSWVDYVHFGPVFPTPSKTALGAPQGIEKLREAVRVAGTTEKKPGVVAVGGLNAQNAGLALNAGATGVAVIREVMGARDPAAAAQALAVTLTRKRE